MESARCATAGDLPILAELWQAAVAELGRHRGGALLVGGLGPEASPPASLGRPDRLTALGCFDDAAVGFATAHLASHPDALMAVVDAIYVEPGFRGVGVGEALAELVVSWAGRNGCSGVDATALPGDRQAKAFFEDIGFVTRALVMHRAIEPAGGHDR